MWMLMMANGIPMGVQMRARTRARAPSPSLSEEQRSAGKMGNSDLPFPPLEPNKTRTRFDHNKKWWQK
jgi:hypothetical protein